jgi:hypothetical protein
MFRIVAAPLFSLAVAALAFAYAAPAEASVVFHGKTFTSSQTGDQFSKIFSSKRKKLAVKSRNVTYDWSTPDNSLGAGATADFDGHRIKMGFKNRKLMAKLFGKAYSKKFKVQLFLFNGSGNELVVESPDELFAALSSPTGDTATGFEIGGKINFALRLVSIKTGKTKQQIKDSFFVDSSKSGVGSTDDGIAMFLMGTTASRKSGVCTTGKKAKCVNLRKMFYGKKGFKMNLALTGSGGGDPVFDPDGGSGGPGVLIIEDEIGEIGENGGTQGGGSSARDIAAVPEPASLALAGLSLMLAGVAARRRARSRATVA